jgi:hypothetical protein
MEYVLRLGAAWFHCWELGEICNWVTAAKYRTYLNAPQQMSMDEVAARGYFLITPLQWESFGVELGPLPLLGLGLGGRNHLEVCEIA